MQANFWLEWINSGQLNQINHHHSIKLWIMCCGWSFSVVCVGVFYEWGYSYSNDVAKEKVWSVIVAISMTLISKIGNNFFQKQPKNKTKQKPAWMKQFKFICFKYYLYKQDWKLIPIMVKLHGIDENKTTTRCCSFIYRFQHSWISNEPKIV